MSMIDRIICIVGVEVFIFVVTVGVIILISEIYKFINEE
jgi:hypothetical protein